MTPLWLRAFVLHARHVRCPQSRARRTPLRSILGWSLRALAPRLGPGWNEKVRTVALPRTVWIYWRDGETGAPPLVRRCIASWRKMNPGWEVQVLDATTLGDHADVSWMPPGTRIQLLADMLRIELLALHGGVWADATCLCTIPLDDWLPARMEAGFFAFARPGPDRLLSNWFIASEPGGALISGWRQLARAYWCGSLRSNHYGPNQRVDQFISHYLFEWAVLASPTLRRLWAHVPSLPAGPPHRVQEVLKNPRLNLMQARLVLTSPEVPVHKLDWRIESGSTRLDALLASPAVMERDQHVPR